MLASATHEPRGFHDLLGLLQRFMYEHGLCFLAWLSLPRSAYALARRARSCRSSAASHTRASTEGANELEHAVEELAMSWLQRLPRGKRSRRYSLSPRQYV